MVLAAAAWLLAAGPTVEVGGDVPVTAVDLRAQRANNTPHLAADPTDRRFVVAVNRVDAIDFDCAMHASGDAGSSWGPVRTLPALPEGADHCYAPQALFGDDGRLYVLFVGLAGAGNRPVGSYMMTSDDRAVTWSEPWRVLGAGNYQVSLAIDRDVGQRGRLHLVWLATTDEPSLGALPAPPNPIVAAHSDDGGRTWSQPVQVSDPARELVVAPTVAIAGDGAVHVAYYDLGEDRRDYFGLEGPTFEGTWSLLLATSDDGGRHFDGRSIVDAGVTPTERVMLIFTMPPPSLVALPGGGLVAAWADARHGDADVLAARSDDAGRSWRPPVRVNDDPARTGAVQELPTLAAAGGRVELVWLDRRRDPTHDVVTDVHHATSTDRGATFAANGRLNRQAFDSRTGASYPLPSAAGQTEWGGRLGLLAVGDRRTVAMWPDTRNVPSGMTHQDLFAATIVHPRSLPVWPVGVAVALLATTAAALAGEWGRRRGPAGQAVGR